MKDNQVEMICKKCGGKMRKKKKQKISPTSVAPTSSWPGSTIFSTSYPTTAIPENLTASRLGGSVSEKPIQKYVTYVCDECENEEIIEIK